MSFQPILIFRDLLALITIENLGQAQDASTDDFFKFLQTSVTAFSMSEDEDLIQVCTKYYSTFKIFI